VKATVSVVGQKIQYTFTAKAHKHVNVPGHELQLQRQRLGRRPLPELLRARQQQHLQTPATSTTTATATSPRHRRHLEGGGRPEQRLGRQHDPDLRQRRRYQALTVRHRRGHDDQVRGPERRVHVLRHRERTCHVPGHAVQFQRQRLRRRPLPETSTSPAAVPSTRTATSTTTATAYFTPPLTGTWSVVLERERRLHRQPDADLCQRRAQPAPDLRHPPVSTTIVFQGQNAGYTFAATQNKHVTFQVTNFNFTATTARAATLYLNFYEPGSSCRLHELLLQRQRRLLRLHPRR